MRAVMEFFLGEVEKIYTSTEKLDDELLLDVARVMLQRNFKAIQLNTVPRERSMLIWRLHAIRRAPHHPTVEASLSSIIYIFHQLHGNKIV